MPLPKITGADPRTLPAQPEKTYPDGFMRSMTINCPSPSAAWTADIAISPFNYDTGDILDEVQLFNILNLKEEAARSPVVAQVVGGVLTVVGLMVAERVAISAKNVALVELQVATEALSTAHSLPVDDPTKADAIAAAELAIQNANTALEAANAAIATAQTALGIT